MYLGILWHYACPIQDTVYQYWLGKGHSVNIAAQLGTQLASAGRDTLSIQYGQGHFVNTVWLGKLCQYSMARETQSIQQRPQGHRAHTDTGSRGPEILNPLRLTDRWTDKQTYSQAERHIDIQTDTPTEKHTGLQTNHSQNKLVGCNLPPNYLRTIILQK